MKSLAVSDRYGYPRYVAHQAYYSLVGRDFEGELMPLALDHGRGGPRDRQERTSDRPQLAAAAAQRGHGDHRGPHSRAAESETGGRGLEPDPRAGGRLDAARSRPAAYPSWHLRGFAERNPYPVKL